MASTAAANRPALGGVLRSAVDSQANLKLAAPTEQPSKARNPFSTHPVYSTTGGRAKEYKRDRFTFTYFSNLLPTSHPHPQTYPFISSE
ncbi:hypothetical protein CSUB01_02203 [Colletotrichum sublineola]|uniref:Uncharacterized protein n=1 Tax=Colletotrichum sublineola TaxID=1173701 RepID=A0A066X2V9_COLSU|nr:hypothetical protein CSUB01_02203 [Colletotrichum sublineola]